MNIGREETVIMNTENAVSQREKEKKEEKSITIETATEVSTNDREPPGIMLQETEMTIE